MRIRCQATIVLGLSTLLSSISLAGVVTYHRARPGCVRGLPNYDYINGRTASQPASVFSLDPMSLTPNLPVTPGAAIPVRERIKFYQMSRPTVQRDHCSLSQVALTLSETGHWTLSMRAFQNPWMTDNGNLLSAAPQLGSTDSLRTPVPNLGKETESLKRNQFFVRVRCFGGYPALETRPDLSAGYPVLFELPMATFWVQRGQPFTFFAEGRMPAAERHFDRIDRVEVEFVYR